MTDIYFFFANGFKHCIFKLTFRQETVSNPKLNFSAKTLAVSLMTTEENILWTKLSSFNLDDDTSSFTFSRRLAKENGWTISYSKNVIEEYKKFLFLCCVSQTSVTPSDQVDQAWHLHLTYTKSYWTDLCKNILQKDLHHNPTKGGQAEGQKFNDFYSDTISLYKTKFKTEPPKTIWPDNEKRFSDINFQRVNLKNYWLFRRPKLSKKRLLLFVTLFISLLFIQASSNSDFGAIIGFVVILGAIIYSIFNNKNGGSNGNNGCSTSGCGHSGHSGCSGCSGDGGCSGCGGD